MSEYQYFAFQAIDRPLDEADRLALRAISSRARITGTSFTNTYHWGNFKGDPDEFMDRWFDLHLHLTNWGTRRFTMKVPLNLVDRSRIEAFLGESDEVTLRRSKTNLVIDICVENEDPEDVYDDDDEDEEDSAILASLAPLRADVLAGDFRIFYLLWLLTVQQDLRLPDEPEPLEGLSPLTESLKTFVHVFGLDADLVAASAERTCASIIGPSPAETRQIVETLPDHDKTDLLVRMAAGDATAALALRALICGRAAPTHPSSVPLRTVGELQERATAIGAARARAAADAKAAAERKQAEAEAQARRARIRTLEQRGEHAWREVEDEIARRNASGYDKAARLLVDLRGLAETKGDLVAFKRRMAGIRQAHAQKARFIERLQAAGL